MNIRIVNIQNSTSIVKQNFFPKCSNRLQNTIKVVRKYPNKIQDFRRNFRKTIETFPSKKLKL